MKIIIAKEAGFCFGVKRAVEMTLSDAKSERFINTLGPLIHNPEFTKFLEKKNIFPVNDLSEIKAKKVVIRSHGIPKNLEEKIKKRGIEVIDATCPFVKRVQKLAEKLEKEGYKVLILGEKSHPEVLGIRSYAPKSQVIKKTGEIPQYQKGDKVALISQTTQNLKIFKELSQFLKKKYKNLKIINTICDATEKRQKAAGQLARKVDIMIVIGGKDSSNTTRLKEICEKLTKTYHIETEDELNEGWFKSTDSVGVTAGASTPDFSIESVLKKLKNYEQKSSKTYSHNNGRKSKVGKKKKITV